MLIVRMMLRAMLVHRMIVRAMLSPTPQTRTSLKLKESLPISARDWAMVKQTPRNPKNLLRVPPREPQANPTLSANKTPYRKAPLKIPKDQRKPLQ